MPRILMHPSSSTWTGASQDKYEALTAMRHTIRMAVNELRAATLGVQFALLTSGKGVGLTIVRAANGSATSVLRWISASDGTTIVESTGFDFANMPADGSDVIIDAGYTSGGAAQFRIFNEVARTNVLLSTNGSSLPALLTTGTSGEFYPRYGLWSAWLIRDAEGFGGIPVGMYWMNEGTGRYSEDALGGNDLDLTFDSPNPATWQLYGVKDVMGVPPLDTESGTTTTIHGGDVLSRDIKKNEATAAQRRMFLAVQDDAGAPWDGTVTGIKAKLSVNGGSETNSPADIVKVGPGLVYVELAQPYTDVTVFNKIVARLPAITGMRMALSEATIIPADSDLPAVAEKSLVDALVLASNGGIGYVFELDEATNQIKVTIPASFVLPDAGTVNIAAILSAARKNVVKAGA